MSDLLARLREAAHWQERPLRGGTMLQEHGPKILKLDDAERIIRAALKDVEARERELAKALRELLAAYNRLAPLSAYDAGAPKAVLLALTALAAYDKAKEE